MASNGVDMCQLSQSLSSFNCREGGKQAGFTSCNNFSGGFSLGRKVVKLDLGALTQKACLGISKDEFISAKGKAKNFTISEEKLTLLDGATELMSFFPKKDY